MAIPPQREPEPLIPRHGGYRKLKSFQVAQLVFDITVRFVELYVSRFSRTCDQMVQAARSGVQNIAEGSVASGTSKKTELKLTNVARASLEELRLDYEDFLRQRGLPLWAPEHPALRRFSASRRSAVLRWRSCGRGWRAKRHTDGEKLLDLHGLTWTDTDQHALICPWVSVKVHVRRFCLRPWHLPRFMSPMPPSLC